MTENHFIQIGELLSNAREDRGLSIEETSRELHIRMRYLRSLEQGAINELPGYPYVKGYLKRYAEFLNLDIIEIMRRFEMAEKSSNQLSFFLPQTFRSEKQASPAIALFSLVAALLLVGGWVVFVREPVGEMSLVEEAAKPQKKPITKSPSSAQQPCLTGQEKLYPPCYWPEPAPQKSVMYLIKP